MSSTNHSGQAVARRILAVVATVVVISGIGLRIFQPSVARAASDPVVVAAGDIACDPSDPNFSGASGSSCQMRATAAEISSIQPAYVLAIGDDQYDTAGNPPTLAEYQEGFGTTWGPVLSGIALRPVPGNHDYGDSTDTGSGPLVAPGYFAYFGPDFPSGVGPTDDWYSFNIPTTGGGTWHEIALDSECAAIGGCGAGSPEETWLRADLAANPNTCTIAYWHEPLYSSGILHGVEDSSAYQAFWTDLYNARATLVVNGSDHDYERFAPQDAGGNAVSNGVTEIVAGTGGESFGAFSTTLPNSVFRDVGDFGVLKLTLHTGSLSFAFQTISGTTPDSGTIACPPAPTQPTVSNLSPSQGSTAGGTPVTITGTNFVSGDTVSFGGVAGTAVVVNSATSMSATSPAGTGTVDVTVSGMGGTSGTSPADQFTYVVGGPQPTVSALNVNQGPLTGGTGVTITGTNFANGDTVAFGGTPGTSVVINSPTSITATSPAGSASAAGATVDVTVSNGTGTSATSAADEFTYNFANGGYGVTLSATSTSPSVGTSVTLTATANQNVGPTPYGISIYDVTTGTSLAHATTGTSLSATVSESSAIAQDYVAEIDNSGAKNIQANSLPVMVTWGSSLTGPTVTEVSPTQGSTGGGTPVTVTGTNFVNGDTVKFGGSAGTSVVVNSATSISVTSPAGAGTVDVIVSGSGGTSIAGPNDRFTYVAPGPQPTVSALSVNYGPLAGGTQVMVTGTNFSSGDAVKFGATAGTGVVVNSPTSITATSPAGLSSVAGGTLDVTVWGGGTTSATSAADEFTYNFANGGYGVTLSATSTAPSVGTSVTLTATANQNVGPTPYGISIYDVTTGTSLAHATTGTSLSATVIESSAIAQDYVAEIDNSGAKNIQANSLPVVVTWGAASTLPTVTNVSPTQGSTAGGTLVTITGTDFVSGNTVSFGSGAGTAVVVNSATSISVTSPAGAGTVHVTVSGAGGTSGTSPADQFTYVAPGQPTVTNVLPAQGVASGGTRVTITGTNFVSGDTVSFGANAGTAVVVNSSTSISVTSPAGTGTVHVTVSGTGGTSGTSPADQFTYLPRPTVNKVSPTQGSTAGGTPVTITGTSFANGDTVGFGGNAGTSVVVNSATSITVTSPAGTGSVDVTVSGPGGTSLTGPSDQFTYVTPGPQPTVSALSVNHGPLAGATSVTITGTNFVSGDVVDFGGTPGTSVVVNSPTSITVTSPAGSSTVLGGTVDVTVGGLGGTSTTSAADEFTYNFANGGYGVTLSATSTAPTIGTSVTLTATANQNVGPTPYGISIIDVTTGAIAAHATTGTSLSVTVSESSVITQGYVAEIDNSGGKNIQANSIPVVVQWGQPSLNGPTVTALSANYAPLAGGTQITVTGTNFATGDVVNFGATAGTGVVVNSPTSITVTLPAGSTTVLGGTVDVTVNGPGGTSVASAADEFTYTFANSGYGVTLSASTTTPGIGTSVTLTATANQNVGPTPYGISIIDATTGMVLARVTTGTTFTFSVSESSAITQDYVAEIDNSGGKNIQADSLPIVVTW